MKLQYITPYLSIKDKFNSIELESFSILTGTNGSSKTHLLKAIENGNIEIEGVKKEEILYFDYTDFLISKTNNDNKIKQQKQRLFEIYHKNVNIINEETRMLFHSVQTKQVSVFLNTLFGNQSIIPIIESTTFDEYKLRHLHISNFEEITKEYFNIAKKKYLTISEKFPKYAETAVRLKKSLGSLNANDFETISFSESILITEVAEWKKLQLGNEYEEFIKSKNKENKFIEWDKWHSLYDDNPILYINRILKDYKFSDYKLKILNDDINLIGYQQYIPNISLYNDKEKISIRFENLSSGEKILMALALLIYQKEKDKDSIKILLLDEIDATLHPSMIKKMQDVIKAQFIQKGKKVIFATHSPTTVALSDNIYLVHKDKKENKIEKTDNAQALNILTESFASLTTNEFHYNINYIIEKTDLPIIFTEGITDKIILEIAWKKLNPDEQMPFYIQECFGASYLAGFIKREVEDGGFVEKYKNKKFFTLFDFDDAGYNHWKGINKNFFSIEDSPYKCLTKKHKTQNVYLLLLPVPDDEEIKKQVVDKNNAIFKNPSLSIELLFFDSEKEYFKKETIAGGGEIIKLKIDKNNFATKTKDFSKEKFKNFTVLFEKINKLKQTPL